MDNQINIPSNFRTLLYDFVSDLSITFPEYSFLWAKWGKDADMPEPVLRELFEYCIAIYPERFFDILYQNDSIFETKSSTNTNFLPNIDFKLLFNCDNISETTKKTIWKYLQLILFTIVNEVKDKNNFGETMNMFDGINEDDLQSKLSETIDGITDFFKNMNNTPEEREGMKMGGEAPTSESVPNPTSGIPDMEHMKDHLKGLFEGKIGSLARELAEEISGEFTDMLGDDIGDIHNTADAMKKIMKNPKKIMDLMKTVSSKLDSKMKSGEVSREEIMKEASELFGKMKGMGGNENFSEMFKNMAKNMRNGGGMPPGMPDLSALGKNMKMDTNALNRMSKDMETKERMRKKMEAKKQENEVKYSLDKKDDKNSLVFSLDGEEKQDKSFIHPDILKELEEMGGKTSSDAPTAPKKKKNKNKNKK
jgi:hypothetical protein